MKRFNYFSGASDRWRTDAKTRARRVISQHGDDALGYVQKRIDRSKFGTFERRRWTYIRKLLRAEAQTSPERSDPPHPA